MQKAYSIVDVKNVDERSDEWIVEGIATTPQTDRDGDRVDPMGAEFALPMPLLWQHMADKPIGRVEDARPSGAGITFRAHLPKVAEPGPIKDRIDEAIQSMRYGLVAAVSIGFRVLDGAIEHIRETGGSVIKRWEWLELSLCTIPANPSAVITGVKNFDDQVRAALARKSEKRFELTERVQKATRLAAGPARRVRAKSQSELLDEQIRAAEAALPAGHPDLELVPFGAPGNFQTRVAERILVFGSSEGTSKSNPAEKAEKSNATKPSHSTSAAAEPPVEWKHLHAFTKMIMDNVDKLIETKSEVAWDTHSDAMVAATKHYVDQQFTKHRELLERMLIQCEKALGDLEKANAR